MSSPAHSSPSPNSMPTSLGPIPFTWTPADRSDYADVVFAQILAGSGARHVVETRRGVGPGGLGDEIPDDLGEVRLVSRAGLQPKLILTRNRLCAYIVANNASAWLRVAGDDRDAIDGFIEEIYDRFAEPEDLGHATPVSFWAASASLGAHTHHRRIEPRIWSEVAAGYAAQTSERVERLLELEPPVTGGRLLLWFGEPGTGKTHALRAVAHQWRHWCGVHGIGDPDRLLNGEMAYLQEVMTAPDFESSRERDWKLIVLEDAGELLSIDARERAGQGLSRLLNASDGLLGLGSKSLFLITTNEPLGEIHPAVHRPGRCLSEIEFSLLAPGEANSWLGRRGCEGHVDRPTSLAELYAIEAGRRDPAPTRKAVGFAP